MLSVAREIEVGGIYNLMKFQYWINNEIFYIEISFRLKYKELSVIISDYTLIPQHYYKIFF
mgnify:CR=1 FL=1